RAWLCNGPFIINPATNLVIDDVPSGNGVVLSVRWLNCGQTPAVKVRLVVSHLVLDPKAARPHFDAAFGDQTNERGTIGPHTFATTTIRSVSELDFTKLLRGEAVVWMYSCTEYEDVFNPGVTRRSEICVRITANGVRME